MSNLKESKTPGGQTYISFETQYEDHCTLVPWNKGKWLRCAFRERDDHSMQAPFTHFTREEVAELLPYLQRFVETGRLTEDE